MLNKPGDEEPTPRSGFVEPMVGEIAVHAGGNSRFGHVAQRGSRDAPRTTRTEINGVIGADAWLQVGLDRAVERYALTSAKP